MHSKPTVGDSFNFVERLKICTKFLNEFCAYFLGLLKANIQFVTIGVTIFCYNTEQIVRKEEYFARRKVGKQISDDRGLCG